jgi:hypothetical protein
MMVMGCLYVFKAWVYANFPVAWNRISLWLTVSLLLVALGLLLLQVVAQSWLSLITTIIVPRVVCVLALHMFMVLFRAYMTIRYQQALSQIKFFTTLAFVYLLFVGGTWFTVSVASPVLTYVTDMIVYFLLQGSVVGMALVSFLLSGITKQQIAPQSHHTNTHQNVSDDTDQW